MHYSTCIYEKDDSFYLIAAIGCGMEYSVLNTTDGQELSAEAGDTIHTKIVVESGNLSIKIQKEDEEPIYESSGIEISNEFDVEIDESGIYSVTVTGEKTKGSVSFVVESN